MDAIHLISQGDSALATYLNLHISPAILSLLDVDNGVFF